MAMVMAKNLTQINPCSKMMRVEPFPPIADLFNDFSTLPAMRAANGKQPIWMAIPETDPADLVIAARFPLKKKNRKGANVGAIDFIHAKVRNGENEKTGSAVRRARHAGRPFRTVTPTKEVDPTHAHTTYPPGIRGWTQPNRLAQRTSRLSLNSGA